MSNRSIYLLALFLIILGCSGRKDQKDVIAFNDFDGLKEWGFENPALTTDRAHSGRYSVKIDNSVENGVGFSEILGKVTTEKPKRIKVECWAFVPETARVMLVLSLNDSTGKTVLWEATKLTDLTTDYQAWIKLNHTITLPDTINFEDRLKCYLWRTENMEGAAYIDDLKLTVVK